MKTNISLISFIVISLFLQSCKTAKIEAPQESYQNINHTFQVSTLNVPIKLDIELVKKLLNDNFKGLLYEDNNLEDDDLMIKAWKLNDFEIKCEQDTFVYSVPLKLWIKAGWKINQFGLNLSNYKEFEAQIVVNFRTTFSVNKNWEIISNTNIESYEWLTKPVIKLGTFNLPITTIADALISTNKEKFNKKIDTAVKENVNLRNYVQYFWEWVQNPVQISEEYKTWLKISPIEIYGTPIRCKNGSAMMDIGFKTTVETFVGKKPDVKINKNLPSYKLVQTTDQNCRINMLTQIEYQAVDSLAKSKLVGQTFTEGKYKVTILDINFYGQADKLVVAVKLKGSFNGNVYFKAVPYYDKETKSIKLKDFDFDFKTRNVLLTSVKWLYKSGFKKMIASKMVLPMSTYFDEIKANIQPNLTKIELYKNISANSTLNNIDIDDLFLSNEGLNIVVSFVGDFKIMIK